MTDEMANEHITVSAAEAGAILSAGEAVALGLPPEKKTTMSVYHLRLEDGTLDALGRLALKLGTTPSAVARRILREGVAEESAATENRTSREQVIVRLDKLREAITSQPEGASLTTWGSFSTTVDQVGESMQTYGDTKAVG